MLIRNKNLALFLFLQSTLFQLINLHKPFRPIAKFINDDKQFFIQLMTKLAIV